MNKKKETKKPVTVGIYPFTLRLLDRMSIINNLSRAEMLNRIILEKARRLNIDLKEEVNI